MDTKAFSRRRLFGYAGAMGAALALDACGAGSSTSAPTGAGTTTTTGGATSAPAPASTSAPATAAGAGNATAGAPTAAMTAMRVTGNVDWWTVAGADIGSQPDQEAFVAEFGKSPAGAGVKVKPTFLPDDGFSEKMTTVLATGSGVPDVSTFFNGDWFPQATDLRDYIARDKVDLTQFSKIHFDTRCRFGDKIIGMPIGVGATMYYYNTTLLEKAGLKAPEWGYTTDQYLQDAIKMSDRSKKVFGTTMPKAWRGEFFAFGARPFSDDGTKVDGYLNGPKTQKAYEFMYDLATSGAVPTAAEFDVIKTEGTGPLDLFNTGRLGFAGLNNGQFQIVDKAGVKFGLIHNPQGVGEEIVTNGWTIQLGIPAASKNKDAAWEYLKWMTTEPGQKFLMLQNHGFTPTIPTLWKEHPAMSDPRLQFFFKILQTRQVWEFAGRFPYFGKVTRTSQELLDKIYLGKVKRGDIKGELDALVAPTQKTLDEERAKLKA